MKDSKLIPIFFSVNDAYAPFLAVALNSIKENASPCYTYHVHILNDDISAENRRKLSVFSDDRFQLHFISLSSKLRSLDKEGKLENHRFGAFSSLTIYFRLFIPVLFPQYDKGIYLDSDIVVPGDISRLWEEPLGNNLIGACADYSIQHIAPFMRYIDSYVGVDHRNYVNSGVLLMNMRRLREVDMAGRFLSWLEKYSLETVAPDQDYLNALCWNSIHYLDPVWDAMPSERISFLEAPQIIHFNLDAKPWLNESVPYDEVFWKYARRSGYYATIRRRQAAFLKNTEAVERYHKGIEGLVKMAVELSSAPVSFRSIISNRQELRLCC
ncbi:MAG: glycosyltransferase family 8 protein [Bacteroidales bacterium]|nr:glycosyltransferase family 8 protein [Bacteroidales bacterium]